MKWPMILLAMASLPLSPAAASVRDAAFSSSADQTYAQTSIFAGASYRLTLGRSGDTPRSRASLKLSGMKTAPGASEFKFGQGLEIAAGKAGKPTLYVAGRKAEKLGDRANLGTGGTVALVVVGVVVAAGVVAALLIDERLDRQNTE
ncbi:MAG: hypothetical protein ABIS23_02695 [Sphingomicrobium sp.]